MLTCKIAGNVRAVVSVLCCELLGEEEIAEVACFSVDFVFKISGSGRLHMVLA